MVYGLGSGRMVDLGVRNRFSIVFPALIKAAIDRGRSGIFGSGKNIWNNVHVDDSRGFYFEGPFNDQMLTNCLTSRRPLPDTV